MWKSPLDTQSGQPIDIQDLPSWMDAYNLQLPTQDVSISMEREKAKQIFI